tara:strand:- start:2937 stop:3110 length:174 start_codon:yes stop_codon:yes gene_type:complete
MALTDKRIQNIDMEIERLQAEKERIQKAQKEKAERGGNDSEEEKKDLIRKVVEYNPI